MSYHDEGDDDYDDDDGFSSYGDNFSSYGLSDADLDALAATTPCPPWIHEAGYRLVPPVYAVLALSGLVGHLPLLLVLVRGPRTSTRLHLLHLAVCNLIFLFMLPVHAVVHAVERWSHKEIYCRILGGLFSTNLCGASLMLAALGVDRYLAVICARGWARGPRAAATRRVHATCAAAWLLALLMSAPSFINYRVVSEECVYDNASGKATVRLLQVLGSFLLPGAVMSFCYGSIAWRLRRLGDSRRQRALRIVYATVVAFAACTLPCNAVALVDVYAWSANPEDDCREQTKRFLLNLVTEVLAYSHCAIHPVLHACLSQAFRQRLVATLLRAPLDQGRWGRARGAAAAGPAASNGGSSSKTELSVSARDTTLVHTVI